MSKRKKEKKVLLVEDNLSLQKIYQVKIEKAGYAVRVVGDGQDVLKAVRSFRPHLILLDIMLPKVDGFTILKKIRTTEKELPVILLTNLGQKEDMSKGDNLGASDYLVKANITPADVVKKVQEHLSHKK